MSTGKCLPLKEIVAYLKRNRQGRNTGETVIDISEIADRAGISRQTVYAFLRGERSEFGEVAQIRLSRVIQQLSADPAYRQTRLFKVDLSGGTPRLLLDGQR